MEGGAREILSDLGQSCPLTPFQLGWRAGEELCRESPGKCVGANSHVGTPGPGVSLVSLQCTLSDLDAHLYVTSTSHSMQPRVTRPPVASLWLPRGSVGWLRGQTSALPGIASACAAGQARAERKYSF